MAKSKLQIVYVLQSLNVERFLNNFLHITAHITAHIMGEVQPRLVSSIDSCDTVLVLGDDDYVQHYILWNFFFHKPAHLLYCC